MKTFNDWLLSKIINYLTTKEGCSLETSLSTNGTIKTIVTDTFGFRYEIQVKQLSRLQDMQEGDNGLRGRLYAMDFIENYE